MSVCICSKTRNLQVLFFVRIRPVTLGVFFRCNSKISASVDIKSPQKQYQENFIIIRIMAKKATKKERWQHDLEFPREMNLLPECWRGDVRWNNCFGVPNHQVKMRQIAKRVDLYVVEL